MSAIEAIANWEAWRAERIASASKVEGKLALIHTEWLSDGTLLDAKSILGSQPSTVTLTEIERENFEGEVIARGFRLWDSNSSAIHDFIGIETFDFDPEWKFEATITQYKESKPVAFEHLHEIGSTREIAIPAEIAVVIEGERYRLLPFYDDGEYYMIFGDSTNGSETYGGGRFIRIAHQPEESKVILDFNRAYLPPCAFSEHFNCPLPPAQNKIKVPIRAGEKRSLFKSLSRAH